MSPTDGLPPHPPLVPPLAEQGALAMDEAELRDWGRRFGRAAHAPLVVVITGELGAGKTTLVQAICTGYGVMDDVTSPTFALVHEYQAPRSPVYHLDLYRLESRAQITGAGLEEYLYAPRGVAVVEWAERWFGDWPDFKNDIAGASARYRRVLIESLSETERRIVYEDFGA